MKKDLSNQVNATYKTLRLGLAVLAFAFPIILYGGGRLFWKLPLGDSLSAYYHYHCVELHGNQTPNPSDAPICSDKNEPGKGVLRDVFVGIIFAVGALLFAYQGFSRLEDCALNLAGIFAWGVALFPLDWPPPYPKPPGFSFTLHGFLAVSFFVCIAYVCIFRAGDTLPLIHDAAIRKRYLRICQLLGCAMVILPLSAWALTSLTPWKTSMIFIAELAGIYVFSTYWVVKSYEASKSNVDEKAGRGKLRVRPHGFSDALRQLPVTSEESSTQQQEYVR